MSMTRPNQASGGMLITVELSSNWDKGNPNTIKHLLQSVVPKLESKTLSSVAPKNDSTFVMPKDSSAISQTHAELQAIKAGRGHTKSLMNIGSAGRSFC